MEQGCREEIPTHALFVEGQEGGNAFPGYLLCIASNSSMDPHASLQCAKNEDTNPHDYQRVGRLSM